MKMTDRIRRNMTTERKMISISIRIPEHVIEDLKEIAPTYGMGGYQALIKAYVSQGLRIDHIRMERERERTELRENLEKHGVAPETIEAVLDGYLETGTPDELMGNQTKETAQRSA